MRPHDRCSRLLPPPPEVPTGHLSSTTHYPIALSSHPPTVFLRPFNGGNLETKICIPANEYGGTADMSGAGRRLAVRGSSPFEAPTTTLDPRLCSRHPGFL
jgi:hypothetical protein